jgi:hypothetical protein
LHEVGRRREQAQRPLHEMEGGMLQVGRSFVARWPAEHGFLITT